MPAALHFQRFDVTRHFRYALRFRRLLAAVTLPPLRLCLPPLFTRHAMMPCRAIYVAAMLPFRRQRILMPRLPLRC